MNPLKQWLNKATKPTKSENSYTPKKFVCVMASVDEGQGMTFNEKAEFIFKQIKKR